MAVYTRVSETELAAFLARYDVGRAQSFKGIAEGVENSNYYLETNQTGATGRRRFILTLYEKRAAEADLPYFLALMRHLQARSFPCPAPIADRTGGDLGRLAGRRAALIGFLDGLALSEAGPAEARAAGRGLGLLHLAAADFALRRANALGPAAWRAMGPALASKAGRLDPAWPDLLDQCLRVIAAIWPRALPFGPIHADYFQDNVFFLDGQWAGVIDFYFACDDFWAYDLAIMLNAWAMDRHGAAIPDVEAAILGGYGGARALEPVEIRALPVLRLGAALRFFLTRLDDWGRAGAGALVEEKDPGEYAAKMRTLLSLIGDAR